VVLTAEFRESTGPKAPIERRHAVNRGGYGSRFSHARMLTVCCKAPRSKAVVRRSVAPNTIR